jgi:hypothetical protein
MTQFSAYLAQARTTNHYHSKVHRKVFQKFQMLLVAGVAVVADEDVVVVVAVVEECDEGVEHDEKSLMVADELVRDVSMVADELEHVLVHDVVRRTRVVQVEEEVDHDKPYELV